MGIEMKLMKEILGNGESVEKKLVTILMEASVRDELYQQNRNWESAVRRSCPGVLMKICCREGNRGAGGGIRERRHQQKIEQNHDVLRAVELERSATEMAENIETSYNRSDDFRKAAIRRKALNLWDSAEMQLKSAFSEKGDILKTDRSLIKKIQQNCSMLMTALDFCNSSESNDIDSLMMMDERIESVRKKFISIRKLLQNLIVNGRSYAKTGLEVVDESCGDKAGGDDFGGDDFGGDDFGGDDVEEDDVEEDGSRGRLRSSSAVESCMMRLNYTLRITLLDVTPVPWRIVTIPECLFLNELNRVLQICFGQEGEYEKNCFYEVMNKRVMNNGVKIEIIGSRWYWPCRQHRFNYPRCIKGRAGVPKGAVSKAASIKVGGMQTALDFVEGKSSQIIPYERRRVNRELKKQFVK
ncbi:MAG: plasmid pRiA4b ORF-3 family protein [Spirochaetia bacterium]|nr:plasmid pRiA4b ORF-3 family protein [Spirochaetia bacterium]